MSKKLVIKRDFYIDEINSVSNFKPNGTIVFKESYWKYARDVNFTEIPDVGQPELQEWYPFANSYYPFGNCTDPVERVQHLLDTKPTYMSLPKQEDEQFLYSEKEVQLAYLRSQPVSFIILSKPDLNEEELGRQLAEYWQCVYIDPQTLIESEIKSESKAGICIDYNLRNGLSIGIDVILRLVKKKVKSDKAKHRGFVICGLPLIPTCTYSEEQIVSESAMFTIKEIMEELLESITPRKHKGKKEHVKVNSNPFIPELKLESPKFEGRATIDSSRFVQDVCDDEDICGPPKIGTDYESQLNYLFDLLQEPFIMIYMQCSPSDCILRRKNILYNIYTRSDIDIYKEKMNRLIYNYFVEKPEVFTEIPKDSYESFFHEVTVESNLLPHLVILPKNFPANIESQLDAYYYTAVNFIERRIMTHEPEYVFKVDARTSTQRMFEIIKYRLSILPIQKPIIPKRIATQLPGSKKEESSKNDVEGEEEEDETEILDHTDASKSDIFEALRAVDTPHKLYKWAWSDWGKKCPVTLKIGSAKHGNPNYAAHFMNKIFFFVNEYAFLMFYRNPRPYLENLKPQETCKFFVFGPPCSGKSAVSKCLGYIYDAVVIKTESTNIEFLEQKEREFYENIKITATKEAIDILTEQRRLEAEEEKTVKAKLIKEWVTKVRNLLTHLQQLQLEREKELAGETKFELSSFPLAMAKVERSELESEVGIAILQTRETLVNCGLPTMDVHDYIALLSSKTKILNYLPENLKKKVVQKPVDENEQFVIDYVNDALSKAVFTGAAELMQLNMIQTVVKGIQEAEEIYNKKGRIGGGWIVDGQQCDLFVIQKICSVYEPDIIILLTDSGESTFLLTRHQERGANRFHHFKEFFSAIGLEEAASRAHFNESDTSIEAATIHDVLSGILDSPKLGCLTTGGTKLREEEYFVEVEKFKLQWREIEEYFQTLNVQLFDIEVTDKSIPHLMGDVMRVVKDWYRVTPEPVPEMEQAEDVTLKQPEVAETEDENASVEESMRFSGIESESGFVKTPEEESLKMSDKEIPYGDTLHFCPVTFTEFWVLWKGKTNLSVMYEDSIYLLSCQDAYDKFLLNPEDYLTRNPIDKFPPPRICVIGNPFCGKTNLAQNLAQNYGIEYVSYESLIRKEFHLSRDETFETWVNKDCPDKIVQAYLLHDVPLPISFYNKRIAPLWFDKPIKYLGFVLDGFPKRSCDVDIMVKYKLIPDIVIIVHADDLIEQRMTDARLADWEENISIYMAEQEDEYRKLQKSIEDERPKKFKELLDAKREQRYAEKRKKQELEETSDKDPVIPQVSLDSLADQQDIDEINRLLDETMSVPPIAVDTAETMRPKINAEIKMYMQKEEHFLGLSISKMYDEEIPYDKMLIDSNDFEKNIRNIYILSERFKFRNNSHFETCTLISLEFANTLLCCGYRFLSKFGKLCPVEYYENKMANLTIPITFKKHNVFPVGHRNYIYFIYGQSNLEKFQKDPLFYVKSQKVEYSYVPIKIGVTGPPKCGKTTLALRIGKEYGLKVISRGQAIRYVLYFLPYSNLAVSMERVLRNGWEVTDEMVAKCVDAASISPLGNTQGVVFDGFPNTIIETRHMSYLGLIPHLVIDLQATKEEMLDCYSYYQSNYQKIVPKYSVEFLLHLREEWKSYVNEFKAWFDREYQLMYRLPINQSMWAIWYQANKLVTALMFEFKFYYINCVKDWPLRLAYMQVTPLEFLERKSKYDSFCPVCLYYCNILTTGGSPPERTGLVQWRKYYYWICKSHMERFLKTPEAYLPPYGRPPPEHLPCVIDLKDTKIKNLFEDGYCIVCYKQETLVVKGSEKFAILYKDQTYLFDKMECLKTFLREPLMFCGGINFRPPDNYPSLNYLELPILGMLEQYIAKEIIEAVKSISRKRPIIPGLSESVSGVIGIGLHLKVNNPKLKKEYIKYYKEGNVLYYERRNKLLEYLENMKRIINPYLHYEEPLSEFRYIASSKSSSLSTYSDITQIVLDLVDNVMEIISAPYSEDYY